MVLERSRARRHRSLRVLTRRDAKPKHFAPLIHSPLIHSPLTHHSQAQFAKYKIWLKPNAEMSFLYGNHVTKAALARMTQSTARYQGVVVYNTNDVPIGFATTARSTDDCRKLEPTAVAAFHVADVGEYLRTESELNTTINN